MSFLAAHPPARRALQWRLDLDGLEREIAGGLIGHQHRDLVDELLEDLRRRAPVAQEGKLVLYQRVLER